jgi:hypothetical protein
MRPVETWSTLTLRECRYRVAHTNNTFDHALLRIYAVYNVMFTSFIGIITVVLFNGDIL